MIETPSHDTCPFCEYLSGAARCAFVTRGPLLSSFLNRAQFERGALLLVPNRHVESLLELDDTLMGAIYPEARCLAHALIRALGAVGLNMFQNNGVRAGQTVSHFHVHLVPRYASSVPWRRFHESEFPHTPIDELEALAAEIRGAL
ncbi:MAG TPA: HIT family protein [Gammaproteobacteria bacterium]